jgi:hypothetical protein
LSCDRQRSRSRRPASRQLHQQSSGPSRRGRASRVIELSFERPLDRRLPAAHLREGRSRDTI